MLVKGTKSLNMIAVDMHAFPDDKYINARSIHFICTIKQHIQTDYLSVTTKPPNNSVYSTPR